MNKAARRRALKKAEIDELDEDTVPNVISPSQKSLPVVDISRVPVETLYSQESVREFLCRLGISEYHSRFLNEGFASVTDILLATDKDFEILDIKLDHRHLIQQTLFSSLPRSCSIVLGRSRPDYSFSPANTSFSKESGFSQSPWSDFEPTSPKPACRSSFGPLEQAKLKRPDGCPEGTCWLYYVSGQPHRGNDVCNGRHNARKSDRPPRSMVPNITARSKTPSEISPNAKRRDCLGICFAFFVTGLCPFAHSSRPCALRHERPAPAATPKHNKQAQPKPKTKPKDCPDGSCWQYFVHGICDDEDDCPLEHKHRRR